MNYRDRLSSGGFSVAVAGMLVFCVFSLLSFLYSSANFVSAPEDSFAANISVGASVPVVLSLSADSLVTIPSPDVSNSTISSSEMSATVSTNNPVGYNLFLGMQEELATDHDNACLRNSTASSPATPVACEDIEANYKIIPTTSATLGVNQWGVSLSAPWSSWSAVPSAIDTALIVDTYSTNVMDRTTTIKAGARVDMGVVAGTYSGVVGWSAVATPLPTITISSINPDYGDPGDIVAVTGTNFDYLSVLYIGDSPCLDVSIVSNTSLTCEVPGLELGRYQLSVVDAVGATYTPLDAPYFTIADPNYQGEIWGFSMDTTIATAVNFRATAPTTLEVDFGSGSWTTFAQGATISGTAIPSAGAGNLARIRIRPVDDTIDRWLPASGGQGVLSAGMNSIITVDYPITTLSVCSKSGKNLSVVGGVSGKTNRLLYSASNLVTPLSLTNTPDYIVNTVGTYFLNSAHYGNTSLTEPIDLSPLAGWGVTSVGGSFLNSVHSDNTSLTEPIDLSPLAGWGVDVIRGSFLSYVHSGNTSLTEPIDLSPLVGWGVTSVGESFLNSAHAGNTALSDIGSFRLPVWAMGKMTATSNALYRAFYLSSATITTGGEPTFMDGTPISEDGTPSTNRQTYTNRSSIVPKNNNWK